MLPPTYHQYSKRPPVGAVGVSLPVDDLWGHVLHSPAEGICFFLRVDCFFTQTKI